MSDVPFHAPSTAALLALCDSDEIAEFFNEFGRVMQRTLDRSWMGADWGLCRAADKLNGNGKWLVEQFQRFLESRLKVEEQAKELRPKP